MAIGSKRKTRRQIGAELTDWQLHLEDELFLPQMLLVSFGIFALCMYSTLLV